MGTVSSRASSVRRHNLSDALFTRTQQRVLGLLFGQPERSFYAKELIRLAGIGSGAAQREIARLAASGLVTVRAVGNQKHYRANPNSPVFDELHSIARKSFGLAEPLRSALSKVASRIQAAFVYGSVAKRSDTGGSDIDLMVIADKLPYGDLVKLLQETSLAIARPISPTVFSPAEFSRRRQERDSFVKRVLGQPKIWLIGDEGVLPA